MPDAISFVRWRDASEDPPGGDQDRHVWVQPSDGSPPCAVGAWLVFVLPSRFALWCDPRPPTNDTLTVEDLRTLAAECLHGDLASVRAAAARVLDAIEGPNTGVTPDMSAPATE